MAARRMVSEVRKRTGSEDGIYELHRRYSRFVPEIEYLPREMLEHLLVPVDPSTAPSCFEDRPVALVVTEVAIAIDAADTVALHGQYARLQQILSCETKFVPVIVRANRAPGGKISWLIGISKAVMAKLRVKQLIDRPRPPNFWA